MGKLKHPNIVSVIGYDEHKTGLYIIMELATGGELFDEIASRGYIPENEAALIIEQILKAVQYLHSKKVVHRDLKPENILFVSEDKSQIKLADFGEAKRNRNGLTTFCGTPDYMAPEIHLGRKYDDKIDIWAVGVITYVTIAGYPPFPGDTDFEISTNVVSRNISYPDEVWGYISAEAQNFVETLLKLEPESRLSSVEALTHPWILEKGLCNEPEYFEEYFDGVSADTDFTSSSS